MSDKPKVKVDLKKIDSSLTIDALGGSSLDSKFFQYSTELAADEVFWMWPDSSIFYVNQSACKKLEYERDELIGMKVWEWDPLFPKEVWPDFWSNLSSKKHMIFETKHMTKSGHVYPVEIQGHHIVDGDTEFLIAYVTDISDRVNKENEIQAHQSNLEQILQERTEEIVQQKLLFEELIKVVPVMINSFDADGNCLIWNKECEDTLGYSFREAHGEPNLMERFYPDHEIRQKVIQDITSPNGEFHQYPVVVKDGSIRQQLWSNFKLKSGMVIGCGVDITDLKEAESKLELEKQRFSSVIENLPLGYHLYELDENEELVFKGYNTAADSILGLDNAEYLDKKLLDAFPSVKDTDLPERCVSIAKNGGSFKKEVLNYKENNIDSVFSAVYFSCYPGAMASVFSDISSVRLNEAKLENTLKTLQLVTDGSQDGFWHWLNPAEDSVEWSDNFFRLLGYAPQEFEPSFSLFQSILHPDDLERTLQAAEEAFRTKTTFDIQYRIKNKEGEYRWFRGRGTPYYNEQGEVNEMAGSISDIHDKKLLEVDLKVQKEEAEKASLIKSQFLANMSHEIRTPMNGVIGMTNQLLKTDLSERQAGSLLSIKSSANALMDIINDILDLSKIEAGKMGVEATPFSVSDLIHDLSKTVRAMAEDKHLEFVLNYEAIEDSEFYVGDPTRVRQVLLNLVGNALKFTKEGDVTLNVTSKLQDGGIHIYRFEVVDSGIGMDEKAQENLFKPFSQADESTTRNFGGTGLGLTICQQLVELMGGKLGFSSTPGEGSTFWFDIPLAKTSNAASGEEQDNGIDWHDVTFPGARVLLVEDNDVNREVALMNLEDAEMQTDCAENGAIALNLIKENQYDVVFMDCQMPVMDGYEATRQIRLLEHAKDLPIIALTANAMQGEQDKCLDAGMTDYLSKPFEYEDIAKKLAVYIPKFKKV